MYNNNSHIVAVTGATGLIGRHIVEQLLPHNCNIRALTRRGLNINGVTTIAGNLLDRNSISKFLDDSEIVIHCAAEIRDASIMRVVNVDATVELAKMAADSGTSVFCYISSAGVVGPSQALVIDESTPCSPHNEYEHSKLLAEQELNRISESRNMRLCILRPTIVVDATKPGLVASMIQLDWKTRLELFVKGGERAHLVHAMDVAAAAVYLAFSEKKLSGVYFIGCDEDERNTVSGIYRLINKELSRKPMLAKFYLPVNISHIIRTIRIGPSLHGNAYFSSKKLLDTGFSLPLGLDGIIEKLCADGISASK